VAEDLLIAVNPEQDSSLPYLIRIPLGDSGIVLKTRDTWPRTTKLYCHRAEGWPTSAEIIERLPVRSCTQRGAAIDLIVDRPRESRSQFVITRARGREMIFWQSPRTSRQARPRVHIPTARAHGQVLEILIDSAEKYPYRFAGQQARTARQRLPAGDYAVRLEDAIVAAVERKTIDDLVSSMVTGRMKFLMADLAALPRAAVVVEEGYSKIFQHPKAGGSGAAEQLAEMQARFPSVPIVFCETRPLAAEWTYRWLGACLYELQLLAGTSWGDGDSTS
jgi:ERCC4 domain